MAFPGTFNISYYRGDTYEFNVYPKNANGQPFNMTGYSVAFTIATSTGPNPDLSVTAYALISPDGTVVRCAIPPAVSAQLTQGNSYVYDIQISKTGEDLSYPLIFTLLKGNVTVTDDVTEAV